MANFNIIPRGLRTPRQHCVLCHQFSNRLICDYCEQDLPWFNQSQFGNNLLDLPNIQQALKGVHFSRLKALCTYQWPVESWIRQLKFHRRTIVAKLLAELFYRHVLVQGETLPQVLIPVPLHPWRHFLRGYNQAYLLARQLSHMTQIPVNSSLCYRCRATQAQSDLSARQRQVNTRQAFKINRISHYQHLAIVDDVITTGATADAMYQCLSQALPDADIEVWSMAISLPHR